MDISKAKLVKIPITDNHGAVFSEELRLEYNGEVCPYVDIDGHLGRQFIAYNAIKHDLNICLGLLDRLKKDMSSDPILCNAVWESFITKYGRCFANASNGRGVSLNEKDVFKGAGDFHKHHKYMINERNEFTAHSGNSDSDIVVARLALMPENQGKDPIQIYISRRLSISADPDVIEMHENLVNHVLHHIEEKLDDLYGLIKSNLLSGGIDALYEKAHRIIKPT